jgi:hypothetical protein
MAVAYAILRAVRRAILGRSRNQDQTYVMHVTLEQQQKERIITSAFVKRKMLSVASRMEATSRRNSQPELCNAMMMLPMTKRIAEIYQTRRISTCR